MAVEGDSTAVEEEKAAAAGSVAADLAAGSAAVGSEAAGSVGWEEADCALHISTQAASCYDRT